MPNKVKDGDKITLIENKFEIRVQVFKSDSSTAQETSNKKESPVRSGSNTGAKGKNNTSSPLRPPPSFKKPGLPTTTTPTTGVTEKSKTNSPPASRPPVAGSAINAIATSTTNAAASTATATGLTNTTLTRGQSPTNLQHNIKDTALKMEIVDDSENTSDSDKDDAMDVDARSSDISAESSFICEDLTDSDNDSDSDNGHWQ
ncbi:hypothetical protein BGZ96_000098 [Linnemannia gamsii]|uniref:Uncharacterized protein n=1 Tax=Linnemannia gamsii TaxID=64522 RepID=A0ABQ7KGY3_9FUNG|nr:hypothetical protein BGZ96_000098 [Linnemannia gamsii]